MNHLDIVVNLVRGTHPTETETQSPVRASIGQSDTESRANAEVNDFRQPETENFGNNGQFDSSNPDIRYSLNESTTSSFSKAVDEIANNEQVNKKYINLGTTPDVFKMIGLPDTQVDIDVRVIRKLMEQRLSDKYGHNLTPDEIKKLPKQLNNPIAILRSSPNSTNPNAFVVLTEMFEIDILDKQQKPVIASLFVKEVNSNLEVIKISSVHGRNIGNIRKFLSENEIFYWNKEKGLQFLNSLGLRLPTRLNSDANLRRGNIKTESDLSQYKQQNTAQNSRVSEPLQSSDRATPEKIAQYQSAISGSLKNHAHNIHVVSRDDLVRPENAQDLIDVEGFFNPKDGKITLIAESLRDEQHAVFVAWHELAHKKVAVSGGRDWLAEIERAGQHSLVKQLADKIQEWRKGTDDPAATSRTVAYEEAIAELYAAHETGDYAVLQEDYGVKIPRAIQNNLGGFLARLGNRLGNIIKRALGLNVDNHVDVFNLLRDLKNAPVSGSLKTENQNSGSRNSRPYFGVRADLFDLPPIPITRINTSDLPNDFQDMKILADKLLRDLQSAPLGTLHNDDMGVDLRVSKKDRQKMGDNTKLSHTTSQSVSRLTDLVKHAIRAESHKDTAHQNENVVAVHRLYAPAEIDGKIYRVKLTVKDYVLNNGAEQNNLHAIEAAEIENALMGTLPASAESQKQVQPTSGRTLSIADLMRGASQNNGEPFSGSLKFSRGKTQTDIENFTRTGKIEQDVGLIEALKNDRTAEYSRRTEKAVRRCQCPYVLFVHGGRCRLVLHFHFYDHTFQAKKAA